MSEREVKSNESLDGVLGRTSSALAWCKGEGHRELRLTSIINQLRNQHEGSIKAELQELQPKEAAESGNNVPTDVSRVRRRPSGSNPGPTTLHQREMAVSAAVKHERLSPIATNDNTSTSRSRSVTPSTSSYPGTPPERGGSPSCPTPVTPQQQPSHAPVRNYSDIMRTLAARYNHVPPTPNEYFHATRPTNGFTAAVHNRVGVSKSTTPHLPHRASPLPPPGARTSPNLCPPDQVQLAEQPIAGMFAGFTISQGGPQMMPAFPVSVDMCSTKTLLALARATRSSRPVRHKRPQTLATNESLSTPLDLSSAGMDIAAKRSRLSPRQMSASPTGSEHNGNESCNGCEISSWNVDDVCHFVESIDICAEYSPNFREQRIDGAGLPLLTEDHLTGMLQMKLGPALKLKSVLAKKLNCIRCTTPSRLNGMAVQVMPTSVKAEPTSSRVSSPS